MLKRLARSGDRKTVRGITAAAARSVGPVLRLAGVALMGCLAAGAAMLMYPGADETRAAAPPVRIEPPKAAVAIQKQNEPIRVAASSVPPIVTGLAEPVDAAPPAIALVSAPPVPTEAQTLPPPVAPPPAALAPPAPQTLPAPVAAYAPPAAPAPELPAPEAAAKPGQAAPPPARFAGASIACLSPDLVTVLNEVQARFGPVTVVSGKQVNTRNHGAGSARHKLHANCKAVDFTVAGKADGVIAFLKARPEVNGVNSYRPNNLIHIDLNEGRRVARR